MKPPSAPPPTKIPAHQADLDAKRKADFDVVKAALEECDGCVRRAAVLAGMTRGKFASIVKRHELAEWAAELRVAATGHAKGRQDR